MSAGISGLVANTCSLLVNAVAKLFVNGNGAIGTADGNYGEYGQVLRSAGSAAQAKWGSVVNQSSHITLSGVAVDFTGIPEWAKRITLVLNSVSTSGTSLLQLQVLTSSGAITTGYVSSASSCGGTNVVTGYSATTGFVLAAASASGDRSGHMILSIIGDAVISSNTTSVTGTYSGFGGGALRIASVVTGIRLTTVNGTDTFDAGSVSISWE